MSQCLSVARVKNGLALQRRARARITVRAVIIPPTYLLPHTHQVDRWYSRSVGSVTR